MSGQFLEDSWKLRENPVRTAADFRGGPFEEIRGIRHSGAMGNNPPPSGGLHGGHHGISLLSGWLPWTVQILVVLTIVVAVGWRTRRWRLLWVPVATAVAVLGTLAFAAYLDGSGMATDPPPMALWVWIGLTLASLAVLVLGWRGTTWWRRGLSALAVPLSLLCVGLTLNQWVGYFPTVQEAYAQVTAAPLPNQVPEGQLASLRGQGPQMRAGKLVPITTPDTASGFAHRQEYAYLPPAWFTGPTPPQLPAIMMIGGEFNTAADWIRTGGALDVIDHYQQTHGGVSPILVFADAGGTFNNDTECVNGPRGNAADHLTKDLRPYIAQHFGASEDPQQWGVVGWSMGGSCAADLAVMHPELFRSFENIAGDLGPTVGDRNKTIQQLYGGNAAAWAQFDPMTVLAHHGPYANTAGWFEDSQQNPAFKRHPHPNKGQDDNAGYGGHVEGGDFSQDQTAEAHQLCDAARKDAIPCSVRTRPGGHSWQFAQQAFADALPWMAGRVENPAQPASAPESGAPAPPAPAPANAAPGDPAPAASAPAPGR
jgi:S-formylglutathione hydrolase FrmB